MLLHANALEFPSYRDNLHRSCVANHLEDVAQALDGERASEVLWALLIIGTGFMLTHVLQ
jgi:hypothetical protein